MSSLSSEDVEKYLKAGDIAKRVREYAVKNTRPGAKLLDLAESIEQYIRELGGEPAFPVNISINEVAAHYTPVADDESVIPDNSIVKIDIGVHIEGYIADTAATVCFNPAYESLVEASENALENVLKAIKPGMKVSEIGRIVEETITSYNYRPIKNLSGHSIDRYLIHSGLSIPNYRDSWARWSLVDGVYAIEPFATNGVGFVREESVVTIFSLRTYRARLSIVEKKVVDGIWRSRRTLPFCERWLLSYTSSLEGVRNTIQSLIRKGILHLYPVLVERSGGFVSQFEHTIIVYNGEIIVTTQ